MEPCKIYDTRSGLDPDFPEELLNDMELLSICNEGKEYGVTTGRRRKVNWLNLNKLKNAINISGTTHLIISKIDIFKNLNLFKLINNQLISFDTIDDMKEYIETFLHTNCLNLVNIIYSDNVENIENISYVS